MTDRISGLFVALEQDIREDDVEDLIKAIKLLRGVAGVSTHVSNPDLYIAATRVRSELREKLLEVLYPVDRGAK